MKHIFNIAALVFAASLFSGCGAMANIHKKTPGKNPAAPAEAVISSATLPQQINGEWVILSAGRYTVPMADEMPYLTLEVPTNRFYASNGCNIINGSFSLDSLSSTIKFDNVLSTMRMCPEVEYQDAVTSVFISEKPVLVHYSRLGHESYLTFYNSAHETIMLAQRHNMDFLNGQWEIITVGGRNLSGELPNVFFDIPELKIHGNSGCNFFNGQIFINPEQSNALDISGLASTRRACPDMETESAVLLALEQTASAISDGSNKVILLDSNGNELLVLRRPTE
ncbi:MAG: META domain-containing protein [Muribaculaceae bacterium]|nr:META domain-containing protein [Muribaculaceae bacterium]